MKRGLSHKQLIGAKHIIRLIPLGDDQACKGALDEFLSISSNERQQLGALARKEAEKSMTWTHCVNELHAMLREVKR